ncbi:hypothetical protein LEN26_020382 [Aphanomyces euteiches]|nr:hypothetical protein LEN26_020382 [Aphanomyces euteiches]KAH9123163.1 hypothetical protein AeMF1_005789 [Aphanomyces euteiches]KAH9180140.1 hypothetical protein AeNC1_017216 [Aphanomyces euteiches]
MAAIPKTMRAVGFTVPLPIDNPDSLVDITADVPTVSGHELLVQVKAVAVNPVDFKLRFYTGEHKTPKILGYDAAGDAAALPLTSIIAYEAIFDRLGIARKDSSANNPVKKSVLILNGAGGVGSMAIQLLKALTDLTVIASASRPQSTAWVTELGADHVVNHAQDIPTQLKALGIPQVDYILAFTDLPQHFDAIVDVVKPQGKISAITPTTDNLPFQKLFAKSVTFVWENMGTRPIFTTDDIAEHHRLLNHVSDLVDAKRIRTTLGENLGTINAANLRKAHAALEAGRVVGKLVLSGF